MKEKKKPSKNLLLMGIEMICLICFLYAAFQLYSMFQDYRVASTEYDELSEQVVTLRTSEGQNDYVNENVMADENEDTKNVLDLPYDYDVPVYEVDLVSLKVQNPDTVGWIILPDSKINYPILLSKDNTEYLTTTFDGKTSSSGAIFMDMYCAEKFESQNTILYGHNMKDGSMFRALNNLTDKKFFWRHHIFCIDTGNGFEEYEIISCYETIETDLSSWQIEFESQAAYEQWLKNIVKRCNYDCVDYDVSKSTITLSTCRGKSGGPGRFIVHLQKK